MEQDRDIYSKKAPPPKEKKAYPDVDFTPRAARAITVRRVVLFVALLAAFLGLASWLFHLHEQQSQRDDLEDLTPEQLAALTRARPPSVAMPELPVRLDELESAPFTAPAGMDPARISEAMGHMRIAHAYLREQELDRAEIAAQRALEIWPDMSSAQRVLGFIYTQRGQFDKAISFLNASLKTEPFVADTYNSLAAIYIQKGEMSRAEELLMTSLQIRPDYVQAYINLGMLHLITGRFHLAAEHFERALEDQPEHTGIRNNLAVSLIRIGRYHEAQNHFQYLIAQAPNVPAWYFNMAVTYTEQQQFDEAMQWVRRGADFCSPMEFQRFMADSDFNELRKRPEFRQLQETVFPDIPTPFGT